MTVWTLGIPAATAQRSPYDSMSERNFQIRFEDADANRSWIDAGVLSGNDCEVRSETNAEETFLAISSTQEFSDFFVDIEKLTGRTFDLSRARYLTLQVRVPSESWISAIKMNFKDADGNFGGIPEVCNHFVGHLDQWIEATIDLRTRVSKFELWHGDDSPLKRVTQFSLNPYNADQAKPSTYHVRSIRFSETQPDRETTRVSGSPAVVVPSALIMPEHVADNSTGRLDFDDAELLRRLTAFRCFESSFQSLDQGIAGNETMAIRIKGSDQNKYIAFLPMLDRITGAPVDFRQVKTLSFSYHLTETSDEFPGMAIFVAGAGWENLLYGETFYRDFQRGGWHSISVNVADLDLQRVRGEGPVLPNVAELRFDILHSPDQKNIEMWIDDFEWK